ncbi:MAG TPA: dihydrolipoyl dehydrogenase [Brevefilum sp.]|nr:dihydrolipoyl dehydrogenase [Brevefilum sp.]HOR19031.1 dihydrolipoyl dehydrogenase [Brevefilum sp.]HPL69290.1 dihydrolipoyl dehydrogenase [Brevefilum sp.]
MKEYDVIVIGAGPGGYVAAIRSAQLGKKTAIIEKRFLGGVCLNVGCIPSKALLKNAEIAHTLRERGKEFGFKLDNLELDYSVAHDRSRKTSDRLVRGIRFLMKKNEIDVLMGAAKLTARDTVEVTPAEGEPEVLKARDIIIATGAHSFSIPGVEVDGEKVVDYEVAILRDTLPESAVIIGGGAIGVEFATIWSAYGVQVTIIEMLDTLLPLEDPAVGKEIEKAYKKRGIKVMTGSKVKGVTTNTKGTSVTVETGEGEEVIDADLTLVAIGFKPNSQGLGLEDVGVRLSSRGHIEVDERMATSVEGIWAIGDVTGKLLLAHVASAMGIVAAENIAGVETVTLDYDMMPRATYCSPQTASFGYTEDQAKERGYDVAVGEFPFQASGKALGLGDYTGFVKIVSDKKYGEILGAHMVGPDVSELLPELTLAQRFELTTHEIARNVHAHPTLSEAIMEAAADAQDEAIHI